MRQRNRTITPCDNALCDQNAERLSSHVNSGGGQKRHKARVDRHHRKDLLNHIRLRAAW